MGPQASRSPSLPAVEADLRRVAHPGGACLLAREVWATTAKAMLLHVLKARLVNVPSSRLVSG